MTPFVWQDRLVKIEDGVLMFSRKGRHDDFDFCPEATHDDMAVAMVVNRRMYGARPLPDGKLLMETNGGEYILSSDRWTECFVQAVDPAQRERDRLEAAQMWVDYNRNWLEGVQKCDELYSGEHPGSVKPDVVVEGL